MSNLRILKQPHEFLSCFFSRFRWFRKTIGGKWELWWIDDPVCSYIWHPVDDWSDRPTALCRGTPKREDWNA